MGVFDGLDLPPVVQPLVDSLCTLLEIIPTLALYCVVLISRGHNKDVCSRKVLPYLHLGPFSSYLLPLPSILGFLND